MGRAFDDWIVHGEGFFSIRTGPSVPVTLRGQRAAPSWAHRFVSGDSIDFAHANSAPGDSRSCRLRIHRNREVRVPCLG